MQGRVKTFLLHHGPKHNEAFTNDSESPALLSLALVNRTIVCGSFAAQVIIHYVFSSCQCSLLQIVGVLFLCGHETWWSISTLMYFKRERVGLRRRL